ncbi:hypothetical protein B0H10DRAFT_823528 [Mycena sp. CBHHK59/15]|nr:hypothetical protein B0H10DRAFT_823528 [Mycena sp. CBHHK59/15]
MVLTPSGRDLGKVTNWFRNLRQSARKRERKLGHWPGSDDDFDDGYGAVFLSSTSRSVSASRSETPRMSSLEREEYTRGRPQRHALVHSSDEEEDAQEAVTPSSSRSPSPAPSSSHSRYLVQPHGDAADLVDLDEKVTARYSGIRVEDAYLLLGFYQDSAMR